MAKFGINDILNAKTKAAGQQAQTEGYKEIYLSPYEVKAAQENTHQRLENIFTRRTGTAYSIGESKRGIPYNRRTQT